MWIVVVVVAMGATVLLLGDGDWNTQQQQQQHPLWQWHRTSTMMVVANPVVASMCVVVVDGWQIEQPLVVTTIDYPRVRIVSLTEMRSMMATKRVPSYRLWPE
jgi:uncharacterized protein (UPF0548 family)